MTGMDLDLVKELYFRENDAKVQLDTRLGIYVALLSATAGVAAFLIRTAWPGGELLSSGALLIAMASLIPYVLSLIWVLRATLGSTYKRVPSAARILAHKKALEEYHWRYPWVSGTVESEFNSFLVERFASAATLNGENNRRRSEFFYGAGQLLLWVIVALAISGLLQGATLIQYIKLPKVL